MNTKQLKKLLILNIPYIILGLAATNLGEAWRLAAGANASKKIQSLVLDGVLQTAFSNPLPESLRLKRPPAAPPRLSRTSWLEPAVQTPATTEED